MLVVLADVASGAQYFSHNPSAASVRGSLAMAARHSGDIADTGIDTAATGSSGIAHANAVIATCCSNRQTVSSITITERWRRERDMSGI